MIDIKPPEDVIAIEFTEEQEKEFKRAMSNMPKEVCLAQDRTVASELHELSKTLKDILKEMRKRKE